ncbi:bZIP transcription factor 30-like [Brassica napus]|nr:bZIP transcription factor 30-like [Brassica napus]
MDGHANIPPSYTGLSQYPATYPFGDESSNRATMPPPCGSSLPTVPPYYQITPTIQPSQNFIPGSSPSLSMSSQPSSSLYSFPPLSPSSFLDFPSARVANKEMAYPPLPYTGGSGSSLPSSVFSVPPTYRAFPSATVANNDMALPPIAYMMPNSSYAEGSKTHKRASSDSIRLNSLMASNRIYPNPIDMPVGVRTQNESVGDKSSSHNEDVNVDVPNGNKRRAGNEIAPPSRIWRSVSAGSSLNEAPSLPQGVSVDVGNDTAFGGMFTPEQLRKIAASDELKAMAASDPKRLKR